MRTLLGVGFIAICVTSAIALGMKRTVGRGAALADIVFEHRDGVRYECDDRVPVRDDGMKFRCRAFRSDGSTEVYDVQIDREGHYSAALAKHRRK